MFLNLEFEMILGLQECEGRKTEDRDIECTYILRPYRDGNIYSPSHFQKETTLTVKKKQQQQKKKWRHQLQKHDLASLSTC